MPPPTVAPGRRIRILLDLTFAAKSLTGTRIYAERVAAALSERADLEMDCVNAVATPRPERTGNLLTGLRNAWWLERELPTAARAHRADLIHSAAYLAPARAPCPVVVNVLDTTFLAFPEDFDWKWRLYARVLLPRGLAQSAAVITLSGHARSEISTAYSIAPGRIHVVPPGVSADFRPVPDADTISVVSARHGLARPYLLFVGAQEPRKNIPALLAALALVRAAHPDITLALAGPHGRASSTVRRAIAEHGLASAVRDLGPVLQADLPALYAGAAAFVYASRLEGFGMPPLEAMACGVPVIAAPNPPLPEVLGDAALFASSDSPPALAGAIERVLADPDLAASLARRGRSRARAFTWERAAAQTAAVYAGALGTSNLTS